MLRSSTSVVFYSNCFSLDWYDVVVTHSYYIYSLTTCYSNNTQPLFALPLFLVAGTETLALVLNGAFGVVGATTILGLSIVFEDQAVKFLKTRYINIPEIPGLESPKLAFLRRTGSAFPWGTKTKAVV